MLILQPGDQLGQERVALAKLVGDSLVRVGKTGSSGALYRAVFR